MPPRVRENDQAPRALQARPPSGSLSSRGRGGREPALDQAKWWSVPRGDRPWPGARSGVRLERGIREVGIVEAPTETASADMIQPWDAPQELRELSAEEHAQLCHVGRPTVSASSISS
jgi:hypothetical protein